MRTKVFGIGFHKTGTTTLGLALEQLGYAVAHGARELRKFVGHDMLMTSLYQKSTDRILDAAEDFDAFVDNPWFLLFREMDHRWPGGKFILTTRNEDNWLKSALGYYRNSESDLRHWIYSVGSPMGNEDLWLERYREHHRAVQEYFAGRGSELLIVDWEKGHGWQEICSFLEHDKPDVPFPRATPARARSANASDHPVQRISYAARMEIWRKSFAALVWLLGARILLMVPFRIVAPLLGVNAAETSEDVTADEAEHAKEVQVLIRRICRRVRWNPRCLVKSIAAMLMLKSRRIPATLYLGVTHNERAGLAAHAWVRCGQLYVVGGRERYEFTVIGTIATPHGAITRPRGGVLQSHPSSQSARASAAQ